MQVVDLGHVRPMNELNEYEAWMRENGQSENTIRQRVRFARARITEWQGQVPNPSEVVRWLGRYTGWTRRTYHNHLSSLFEWMIESGRIAQHPLDRAKRPPIPRPRPQPLTADEVGRVLDAATGNLRTWIMLGLLAGLRAHEIAKVRGEDVNERHIAVVGKGGQAAIVPTNPLLWEVAQDHPARGWWFPSPAPQRAHISAKNVEQRTRQLFRKLDIPDGGIHRTRATYGTSLLRNGVNIRVVQELMRHRSLSSTEHYLGVADDELKSAIASLSYGTAA